MVVHWGWNRRGSGGARAGVVAAQGERRSRNSAGRNQPGCHHDPRPPESKRIPRQPQTGQRSGLGSGSNGLPPVPAPDSARVFAAPREVSSRNHPPTTALTVQNRPLPAPTAPPYGLMSCVSARATLPAAARRLLLWGTQESPGVSPAAQAPGRRRQNTATRPRQLRMEFRWVAIIALWTLLSGPMFDSPGLPPRRAAATGRRPGPGPDANSFQTLTDKASFPVRRTPAPRRTGARRPRGVLPAAPRKTAGPLPPAGRDSYLQLQ